MKYRTLVDINEPNASQSIIARAVVQNCASGSRILDLGCASGDLGAALVDLGFEVIGVEADPGAAAIASPRLTDVIQADLATDSWVASAADRGPYAAVCLGDVLEHLVNPESVLCGVRTLLEADGLLVLSIPNVAHGSVRLALLQGRWEYTAEGLLDQTHVRFFTMRSAVAMVRNAGFGVLEVEAPQLDPLATEVQVDDIALPGSIVEWVRDQDGATDYQYVITARVGGDDGAEPPVKPAIILPRPTDEHAARRRAEEHERLTATHRERLLAQLEGERFDRLTSRDAIVGLEATAATLKRDVIARDETLHAVRKELIQTHARLAAAIEDSQTAHERLHAALTDAAEAHAVIDTSPTRIPRRAARRILRALQGE